MSSWEEREDYERRQREADRRDWPNANGRERDRRAGQGADFIRGAGFATCQHGKRVSSLGGCDKGCRA